MTMPRPGQDRHQSAPLLPAGAWQQWWTDRSSDDRLVRVASEQGFVLATGDLAQWGVTRAQARTAVRRQRWVSPARGFVAPLDVRDVDEHLTRRRRLALAAAAAVSASCGHVVSGPTGAVLHGLPVMVTPDRPDTTLPGPSDLGRASTRHVFGAALEADECTGWFGVPVTDVARTAVDVARHSRRGGLVLADAALREGLTTPALIERSLARSAGWPGVRKAREVLRLADGRAESPLESITRLALHDDGFPPGEPQFRIGAFRVDFAWPAQRLVLEADGRSKYTSEERWEEKKREQYLRRSGWSVERVVWQDVTRGWPRTRLILGDYF